MKKKILSRLAAVAVTLAALVCSASVQQTITSATSADFDCVYGVNDKTDPLLANGYGCTDVVTYSEEEATEAGIPAGFSGDVVAVVNTATNRGLMLDFSSMNIPVTVVDSITFRVYMNDDNLPNDDYPELRIPEPGRSSYWTMRYPFADKTGEWQDVVLKSGNGSFFTEGGRAESFERLAKDGILNKFELSMRHNGSASNAAFYIDSVKLALIDDGGAAPVINYEGEDVVSIAKGQKLNFDVSAVDALEGAVDVECVWDDPSKLDEDGTPMAGTHTLTFVARDYFGNTAEKTITVIVTEPDVTPPTLVVPMDTVYAKIGARSLLTFTATDEGGEVVVSTEWSEGALDRKGRLTEGTHTLTVTATDLSGNQTQKVITFIVTAEGDTADVVIDEEALCPDVVEPDSSVDSSSSEEDSSIQESSSSKEDSSSEEDSSIQESSSSKEDSSSEEDISSEEESSSEKSSSSKKDSSSKRTSSSKKDKDSDKAEEDESESTQQNGGNAMMLGCFGTVGVVTSLPLLALCACALIKRKKD